MLPTCAYQLLQAGMAATSVEHQTLTPTPPSQIARAAAVLAAVGSALFLGRMPLPALARHTAHILAAAFQAAIKALQQLPEQVANWRPVSTPEGHLPASTVYTSPAHAYGLPRRFASKVRGLAGFMTSSPAVGCTFIFSYEVCGGVVLVGQRSQACCELL